ncbi:hypothetical protein DFR58_102187 [Anaerobacterium chartisolvens]|uniref:Uncharacterized protein n=1 Tax=Anaerobacterium chartisolvens TaxID=1297424 RepID=A0A369BI40_9FIRM|nr:hypothetical protein [Anaerobacterium chartisolvens]RCX20117.1 hypothetical protein DFR58_102187 [Anaerobacterium chartisolvens]
MYKQFCKNLRHFISIMESDGGEESSRRKNAEALLPLADIEEYKKYKDSKKEEYRRISSLIYDISRYSEEYPSLKRLVWELWAYGFDIGQANEEFERTYEAKEVARLADLMLSTHYF